MKLTSPAKPFAIAACIALSVWMGCCVYQCCKLDASVVSGTVVGKDVSPAYFMTTYVNYGNGVTVPVMTYIPESWYYTVEGVASDGKTRHVSFTVSESYWHTVPVGAAWTKAEGITGDEP